MARRDYSDLGEVLLHSRGDKPDWYLVDLVCGHELKPILSWHRAFVAHYNGQDGRECGGHDCLKEGMIRSYNAVHFSDAVEWSNWLAELKVKSLPARVVMAAERYSDREIALIQTQS